MPDLALRSEREFSFSFNPLQTAFIADAMFKFIVNRENINALAKTAPANVVHVMRTYTEHMKYALKKARSLVILPRLFTDSHKPADPWFRREL